MHKYRYFLLQEVERVDGTQARLKLDALIREIREIVVERVDGTQARLKHLCEMSHVGGVGHVERVDGTQARLK